MRKIRETYNDGFLTYGSMQTIRSSTGKRTGDTFVEEGRLAYSELSCREEDYAMAAVMSASLDIKVKTPLPPDSSGFSRKKVKRRSVLYDVIKADPDRTKGQLFLYLQEVGG